MITPPDPHRAVASLRSTTCPACGQAKKRAQTLCRRDYFKLPIPMRKALYARVGSGYEQALAESLNYLGTEFFSDPPKAA